MAERTITKPEIASQKKTIKLPPAIGDWTTYRPPKILVKKVKSGLYGFDRLSKDELNTALQIHYRFIEELLTRLKIDLSLGVEFLSCQIEQTNYLGFLRSQNSPVVQGKIAVENIHEGIQLFFDLGLAHSLIDHALGSHALETLNRGLTEAENTVFAAAFDEYLPFYSKFFAGVFSGPIFSLVGSPDAVIDQAISTSATYVSFSAEVVFNDNPFGKITFGYLASSLKSLLKQYREKTSAQTLNFGRLPLSILNKIAVPVAASLGRTELSTSDIHNLEIGDVVSLDTLTNSAVTAVIGSILKMKAQPGLKNKKRAVRLTGFNEEDVFVTPPTIETVEAPEPPEAPTQPSGPPTPAPQETTLPEEEIEEDFLNEELPEEEFTEEDFDAEFSEEETGQTNTGGL